MTCSIFGCRACSNFICQNHVKVVAQERGFYSDEIENWLNKSLELPGNKAMDKLLAYEDLDQRERFNMSAFMFTMMSRGPFSRERKTDRMEKFLPEFFEELYLEIQASPDKFPDDFVKQIQHFERERKSELIAHESKKPAYSKKAIQCLLEMTWEIIEVTPGMHFVTSDTAATFHPGYGFIDPDFEFTFTLSKDYALVAHNRGDRSSTNFRRYRVSSQETKEINRRLLETTYRFVYSSKKEDWIEKSGLKQSQHLNSIRWAPALR